MGKAHALALAQEGADVTAVDICRDQPLSPVSRGEEEALNKLVEEIRSLGRRAIGIKCVVSKADEVERMVKTAIDEFGKIYVLVNNAGVAAVSPFVEVTEKEWD